MYRRGIIGILSFFYLAILAKSDTLYIDSSIVLRGKVVLNNVKVFLKDGDILIDGGVVVMGDVVPSGKGKVILRGGKLQLPWESYVAIKDRIIRESGKVVVIGAPYQWGISKGNDSIYLLSHTVSVTVKDNSCNKGNGPCDGSVTVVVSGGIGPFDYNFEAGAQINTCDISNTTLTTIVCNNICAGSYNVEVTDNGVSPDPETVIVGFGINEPPPLGAVFNPFIPKTSCSGVCDAQVTVTVTGGSAPYQYSWCNGQTTNVATGLCAGSCPLTITDVNNCTATKSVNVSSPPPISMVSTIQNIQCGGANNGSIQVTVSGGTPGYTFQWSTSSTVASGNSTTASALPPGTYHLTVIDSKGCSVTDTYNVTAPPNLTLNTISVQNPTCNGYTNGLIIVSVSGGTQPYTYTWNPPVCNSDTCANLGAGTYDLTVVDNNGCSISNAYTLTEPPAITPNLSKTDETCPGLCDGSVSASPAPPAPYSFQWTNSAGNIVCNASSCGSLCPDVYKVTITDPNGCTVSGQITVSGKPPFAFNATLKDPTCNGSCDGGITVTPSGGGGAPYSYNWGPPAPCGASPTCSPLCADSYPLTVTDNTGCSYSTTFTLSDPPVFVLSSTVTNAQCLGTCDGAVSITIIGGVSPYTITWDNNGNPIPACNNQTFCNNLCAGTYSVNVTDANGCNTSSSGSINYIVTVSLSTSGQINNCGGVCDGQITATASGGTSPYNYVWSDGNFILQTDNGVMSSTITGLCPGTYYVTATEQNGCQGIATVTLIAAPGNLAYTLTDVDISCAGANNGMAMITLTGTGGPYTITWSTGQSNSFTDPAIDTIKNLSTGIYYVTLQDANCYIVDSFQITAASPLAVTITSSDALCNGSNTGSASVTVTGGTIPYSYTWNPGSCTSANCTGLSAGTYTVTISDANGCVITASTNVNEPPLLTITSYSVTSATCYNTCDGSIAITVSGGTGSYTYSWSPGGCASSLCQNLCPGTYYVTISDDNGCTITNSYTVQSPSAITVNSSITSVTCNGGNDGAITVTASGGTPNYIFNWGFGSSANTTNAVISNLSAGTYTITVSDNNNCTLTKNITVNEPQPITITVLSNTGQKCAGQCDGYAQVTASGGVGGYTYSWSSGETGPIAIALCPGTASVTVNDANMCSVQTTLSVATIAPITSSLTVQDAVCGSSNGSVTISASGGTPGYSYNWSNGCNSNICNALSGGIYYVTIKDANMCEAYDTAFVAAIGGVNNVSFDVTPAACGGLCDGTANVNVVSGGVPPFNFLWIPTGQTSQTATSLCGGNYTVQITDANNCISFFTTTVPAPNALTLDNQNIVNASCAGSCDGSVLVTITGGTPPYTYSWGSNSTTNLCAGTVNLTVSDNNGCTASFQFTINEPPPLSPTLTVTSVTCFGGNNGAISISVSGGSGGYSYIWSDPSCSGTSCNNLTAGTYSITVTDANGCQITVTTAVNQPSPLSSTISNATSITCWKYCNGSAEVNVSGGAGNYSYQWSSGENSSIATALCSGWNYVTINDANACSIVDSVNIQAPSQFNLTSQQITPYTCGGQCNGAISITISGGIPPYSYSWSAGQVLSPGYVSNLCNGTLYLTLTDANSCDSIFTFTIPGFGGFQITSTQIGGNCSGVCDGSITVSILSGGTPPFQYNWNTGQNTPSISNLCAGTMYIVTVTDANLCSQIDTFLWSSTQITIQSNITAVKCSGECNGSIIITPTGGTYPYTYTWNPPVSSDSIASALCAGTYSLTVKDNMNCSSTFSTTIIEPTQITISQDAITNPYCSTSNDGQISITVSGGTPPYTYNWIGPNSFNSTNEDISGLIAGTYYLTASDANSCLTTLSFTLTPQVNIQATAYKDTTLCLSSTTITLIGYYQPPNSSIMWTDSSGTVLSTSDTLYITPTSPGSYNYIFVVSSAGCSNKDTVNVLVHPLPFANAGPDTSVLEGHSIQIGGSPSGPPGSSFLWSPEMGLSSPSSPNPLASPSSSTYYILMVKDQNGCVAYDTVFVQVIPYLSPYSAFSPNGDGINDVWNIKYKEFFPNMIVEIYNRWGELLFRSQPGYPVPWDGTYNGKPLPIGTYYYIIYPNTPEAPQIIKGTVTIIRE